MKIPENQNPYKVIINGVEKVYEAGAEVDVDAATAAIIKNADAFPPAPETPVPPIVIPEPSGGGGDGALIVNITWDDDYTTETLDKTWQEISDASNVVIVEPWDGLSRVYYILLAIADGPNSGDGKYHATVGFPNKDDTRVTFTKVDFKADSADGYPSATIE